MTNIPGSSSCGGGAFNDGTVALKFLRRSPPEADKPLPKSLLHLSSAVPWLRPGTKTEPACYNLGRILLWTFQKRPPQPDLHFFKKLNCYQIRISCAYGAAQAIPLDLKGSLCHHNS